MPHSSCGWTSTEMFTISRLIDNLFAERSGASETFLYLRTLIHGAANESEGPPFIFCALTLAPRESLHLGAKRWETLFKSCLWVRW